MKKIKLVILLFVLGMSTNVAWAGTYYSSNLTVKTASGSTGNGKVYAAEGENVPLDGASLSETYACSGGIKSDKNQTTTFSVHAVAKHGYRFVDWTNIVDEGNGNPRYATGFTATSNPALIIMDDGKDESSTDYSFEDYSEYGYGIMEQASNNASVEANFEENPETPFNVSFLKPVNGSGVTETTAGEYGTYALSSYIEYPIPTQGGDPIPSYSNDEITLTATPAEGYGFRNFYYVDGEDKISIGTPGVRTCTFTLSSAMTQIGCIFVQSWNVSYVSPTEGGTYTAQKGETSYTIGGEAIATYPDDNITLSATPGAGYAFYRFVGSDGSNTYTIGAIGVANQTLNIPMGTTTVKAEFTNKPFMANGIPCANLRDAIQATRQGDGSYSGVILQLMHYTVLKGYYTIPEGVTLLVPQHAEQISPDIEIQRKDDKPQGTPALSPDFGLSTYLYPSEAYKVLTLSSGVTMEVYGDIEVGGTQNNYAEQANGVGRPTGYTYGHLIMEKNSKIILNKGANLRAWGFVTGEGEIDARRGSTVSEQFQIYDFKGGSKTLDLYGNEKGVFPMTQYYIQNVEVPVTYRPGSALWGFTAAVHVNARVKLIGVYGDAASMFLMNDEDDSEDTWVRKSYQASTDQQVYEVNNSAGLGNLELSLGGTNFNSSDYVLPITNNMKIHLKSGELNITQSTVLLAGAEIEIDKKASVVVEEGKNLFLYDSEEWIQKPMIFSKVYGSRIKYRPGGVPTEAIRGIKKDKIKDASINIHGRLELEGSLYTTVSGANIFSSIDDAGTVLFGSVAPSETSIVSLFSDSTYKDSDNKNKTRWFYWDYITDPALLTNDAGSTFGSFSETAGTAAGKSFCFIDIDEDGKGEWISLTINEEDECLAYDQNNVYYIKPQGYVPISVGRPAERLDHTYRDAYAGTGKIYIKTAGCQWWEVEPVAGSSELFHCLHPSNDTYYYWVSDMVQVSPGVWEDQGSWQEKKFNITFKNWDGTVLTFVNTEDDVQDHYELTYGSMPNWLSANPERPADADFTYSFTGWTPALHEVTSDEIYMATYAKTPIKFTIIYKFDESYNDGAEIKREQLERNAVPTPPTTTRVGYYLQWTPAISAVTGNQTYTAHWLSEEPTEYEITFYDYDGTTVLKQSKVAVGDEPTPPADPTGKPATKDYTYVFDHWTPSLETVSHDGSKSYTAVYTSTPRKYEVKFYKEDGIKIGETQQLDYSAMPNVPAYSKDATDAKTYTLVWSPLVGPATKDQDYTATFTETTRQYRVDWKVVEADATERIIETKYVDYGATPVYSGSIPTKATANGKAYTFIGWDRDFEAVEDAQTYIAQFSERDVVMTVTTAETVSSSVSMETVTIEVGGKLTLSGGAVLTTDVLILESNGTSSGQLDASLVNATNAYFDWTMNGTDGTQTRTWYAVAVPWEVNAETGISIKGGRTLVLGRDFDLVWYDGEERAANGDGFDCWKYVEYEPDKIMHPGRLYMMYFGPTGIQTIRFAKKSGAAVIYNSPVSVETYAVGTGDNKDGNWNGIANPRTYYASLGTGASYAQVLNNGSLDDYQVNHPENNPVYKTINLASSTFNVGKPLFVQAVNPQSVIVNKAASANIVYSAPKRDRANNMPEGIDAVFAVTIGTETNHAADNLFIQATEDEKEDTYVIGQDLAKGGVAKTIPQLWVNRYNSKLSVNTQALLNGVAEYPLTIFAPNAGEYVINTDNTYKDYTLYLIRNGEAIWNLTNSDYTFSLPQGNTTGYGLRIIKSDAPQTATGMDEAVVDANGETMKVIINDQVFIIRGNQVYSIDGQLVK